MHLSEVASAVDGKLIGSDCLFQCVTTDSRTQVSNGLFVALSGENFDGHDYIEKAQEQGAVAALVSQQIDCQLPHVVVADTQVALGKLAASWRTRFEIPFIAITGSNGKTTVKELVASILRQCGQVLATKGNLNNELGVPLTLLSLRQTDQFAVIEMGANHSGEIAYLSRLAQPAVAILNNAAPAHLEGFKTIEDVATAKGEIIEGLGPDGIAILNADDPFYKTWCKRAGVRRWISFGLNGSADVHAYVDDGSSNAALQNTSFRMTTPAGSIPINLPLPGLHNVKNALAATAACLAVGIDLAVIKKGLEEAGAVEGRLNVKECRHGLTVIDDSYNANPASVQAALLLLSQLTGKQRVLVLGDMAELGDTAKKLHKEIGVQARELGIEFLYATGELSSSTVEGFGENGFYFENREQLLGQLQADLIGKLKTDVVVLVKASRSSRLETVVQALYKGVI
ncbi:MAG: UDP-N-acetylmuramoyl-tripeptide--D-alanyl-D-alanine ligase [Gammaproteobacteria bacterium]|nr:UDP-N-acetylmuramoyl-tripeptide--D-alanyl-D-alanine ligase [Gammaproteobacteria bacterium]